uniref:Integrase catalytic domain-containing protein n=1 Tax=Strongyloides papillosus TaxID=174720 RepID=A0A0N5C510_STREA
TPFLQHLAPALMNRVFCYHGFPKTLRSDGGGNFRSEEFGKWLSQLNIVHEMSAPHHSQGNCLVERTFKWIADTVAKVARERPNYWPEYLPMVMFYYNSMKNATTGCSPFMLTHLREPNCLLDQFIGSYSTGIFDSSSSIYDMMERAAIVRESAKHAIEATRSEGNKNNGHHDIPKYDSKQLVLVKMNDVEKDVGSKFKFLYQGPFFVTRQVDEKVYYKKKGSGKEHVAHITNVKPFYKDLLDSYLAKISNDA